MDLRTRARDFALTEAIAKHVERKVAAALEPVGRWVMSVTARLRDVNAGRGGIDKRCRLVATLRHRRVAVAEGADADLYAAIDNAAGRLRRAALRAVRRPFARNRKDPQRPGTLLSPAKAQSSRGGRIAIT